MSITRDALERLQVWFYLAAVVVGLVVGSAWPGLAGSAEALVWPLLAVLLFATFTQMPLSAIPAAFADARFLVAALTGNFVLVPAAVWGLVQLTPDDESLRLGLFLVLLMPCTDWFITFSQLGRGDATRATALTPISLVVQLLLLPLYLWLLADVELTAVFGIGDVWPAVLVVLVPLLAAAVFDGWVRRRPEAERVVSRLGWWPVPLLAIVILLVATSNVTAARGSAHLLPTVIAVALAYLVVALLLAKLLATVLRLPAEQERTLAFSLGTRNSFIVLPFALALPVGSETASLVVVTQSLVELFGMTFFLWFVPRVLFRELSRWP